MKKKYSLSIIMLFVFLNAFSQPQGLNFRYEVVNPQHAGKIFRNPTSETIRIQGSPYSESKFLYADIENVSQKYFMRYNAYSDNFEFITFQNDTLAMNRLEDFGTITFTKTNKKYCFVNYLSENGKRAKGYLVEMYTKSDFSLYKKESITFYGGKKAKTSLESDLPANYSKVNFTYYFKTKSGSIIKFPEGKKQLIKLYPGNKEGIESFLKENKIDFDLDSDKVKIINFLSTL